MKNIFLFTAFTIFTVLSPSISHAKNLSGKEIVKHSDDLLRGDSMEGRYVMTVTTPKWERELTLDVWTMGRTKTFIRILSPAKEAGIGTLRVDTNMWNYLPKVEKTIKIPPSMMFQAWMGSDFTNDDLVKESSIVNDYNHTIIGEENMNGKSVYKIDLDPLPDAAVTWGKLIFYIETENLIPVREEFYDEDLKLIKVLSYSNVRQMSDRQIPTLWEMESEIDEGHRTKIQILRAEYNQSHSESIYSLGNLKRVQ